jgi:hypothetical protein
MRRFYFILLFFIFVSAKAQTVKGDFDLKNYPEISFVWNEYNPDVKDSTQFILSSNGEKMPFKLQNLPYPDTIAKNKTILFLWEDLNHRQHSGQSEFTKTVLYHFLKDSTLNEGDKFNVALFDRKGGNDAGSSIHTILSNTFTSDRNSLAEAVRNLKPKYDFFSNQANSELYIAIEEGIEMLQKEPSDRIRVIVVFTAGSNQDSYGGRNSIDENRALSLKIPVYVVKYPISGCEHCSNIDVICRKTYGLEIATGNTTLASALLRECYGKIDKRHYGQDYRLAFLSGFPRDGKQHPFVLSINGKEYPLSFTSPACSLKDRIKEHVLYAVLIGFGLLVIIGLIVYFINRTIKKRRKKWLLLESQQHEIQREANANRHALENYRQQKEAEEKRTKAKEQEQHFLKMMQAKNLFPRLQYSVKGETITYTVHKPETSIGRDTDNDLILHPNTVSRHHAQLIFNGNGFEIQDLGSANKVIVNGAFIERKILANGDIVGLGEVIIYFYN